MNKKKLNRLNSVYLKIRHNQSNKRFLAKLFFIVLSFSLFGCKTTSLLLKEKITNPQILPIEELAPQKIIWQEILTQNFPTEKLPEQSENLSKNGIQKASPILYTSHIIKSQNVKWTCVKIDLDAPWQIVAEPQPQNLEKNFFLIDFSQKNETTVAINTVPFSKNSRNQSFPVGIVKIEGKTICPENPSYCALALKKTIINPNSTTDSSQKTNFSQKNDLNQKSSLSQKNVLRAKIFSSQNKTELEEFDYAFGGFFVILENGEIPEFKKIKRSRTAAGTSSDGRFLYLFAANGINKPSGKNGLNYQECALILEKLGCTNAMQFDGGHSTGLTATIKNTSSKNETSENSVNKNLIRPSLQRKIAAALGFKLK